MTALTPYLHLPGTAREALTFYADPVGTRVAELTIEEQARRLARAAGAAGSGAEYLLRTVRGLAEHDIHDDYIWLLQQLVAREIEAAAEPYGVGAPDI